MDQGQAGVGQDFRNHSLAKGQKKSLYAQLEPKAQQLVEQVEQSGDEKPHRSLIKLDLAKSLLPKAHPLREKIARLRLAIEDKPATEKTQDHNTPEIQNRKGQEGLAIYLHARGQKALKTEKLAQAAWAFREALKYNAEHQGAKNVAMFARARPWPSASHLVPKPRQASPCSARECPSLARHVTATGPRPAPVPRASTY